MYPTTHALISRYMCCRYPATGATGWLLGRVSINKAKSVLAYLDYFLCNSGTVEASEVTHLGKGVNSALLQMGFY